MTDLLVCYCEADRSWADWIVWHLEGAGYSVVEELWDLSSGSQSDIEIWHTAEGHRLTLAVLSRACPHDLWQKLQSAMDSGESLVGPGRPLLTVCVDSASPEGVPKPTPRIELAGSPEKAARDAVLEAVFRVLGVPERGARAVAVHFVVQTRPAFPAVNDPRVGSAKRQTGEERSPIEASSREKPKVPRWAWWVVGIVVPLLASVVPFLVTILRSDGTFDLYVVRATVLGVDGMPVEDAIVWSTLGGEPKQVSGGWQFDIPRRAVPELGQLTLFAAKESEHLKGRVIVTLGPEPNVEATIRLLRDRSALVRGSVESHDGKAVPGAWVAVVSYPAERVRTSATGQFVLQAHSAPGESVRLRVFCGELPLEDQYHLAGEEPVTVRLPPGVECPWTDTPVRSID